MCEPLAICAMCEPLAHSARPKARPLVGPQTYYEHIEGRDYSPGVHLRAILNAQKAATFYSGDKAKFVRDVEDAAIWHDLGKLDDKNQTVLRQSSTDPLPVWHEDAGCAYLKRLGLLESTVLVAAHHAGLFSQDKERGKQAMIFRNPEIASRTDSYLDRYVKCHLRSQCPSTPAGAKAPLHQCGFTRRVALSCLVDADHGDTARHYGSEVVHDETQPRWRERLEALDRYVATLPSGETDREKKRNELRRRVYDACRAAPMAPSLRACDAPVGSGKTTAIMAHLLRVATERNLRHILVVLPYTNIIKQSVDIYRQALVLDGERPFNIVAEHHHQADFEELSIRQLATLWKAPIIVTTAVQFFETLGSNHPARLRKLHELPGSALFIDETHAAIPTHLWPQVWRWLETCTRDWGGHVVFASGSLPRFWELREFVDPPKNSEDVPDLISKSLHADLVAGEKVRIKPLRHKKPFDCASLIKTVAATDGPRVVILNTVQSASVLADKMRNAGYDVMHLSTALAPIHREPIVEMVKKRLKGMASDWTLVATSCVEAGMDFSFRTGFRESSSASSLIQLGGRVSRGGEHLDAQVWDFRSLDSLMKSNPAFEVSRRVLDRFFDQSRFTNVAPSDIAKEAMRQEWTEGDKEKAERLIKMEAGMEYPEVSGLCRVIEGDTRLVVIDKSIVSALEKHEKVQPMDLVRHSVQIRTYQIQKLALTPIFGHEELFKWTAPYDPDFLGYMAGVLPLVYAGENGLHV